MFDGPVGVRYPPTTAAVEAVEEQRAATRLRPSGSACGGALLNAPIGTGKTWTMKLAASIAASTAGPGKTPVLYAQMPTAGSTDSVPTALLAALGHSRPDVGKPAARWLVAGRRKPWAAAIAAMLDGRLPFSNTGSKSAVVLNTVISTEDLALIETLESDAFVDERPATVSLKKGKTAYATRSELKLELHRVALVSTGHDPYSNIRFNVDPLRAGWIDAQAHLNNNRHHRTLRRSVPSFDHVRGLGRRAYELCTRETNSAKTYMSPAQFIDLCHRVSRHRPVAVDPTKPHAAD